MSPLLFIEKRNMKIRTEIIIWYGKGAQWLERFTNKCKNKHDNLNLKAMKPLLVVTIIM